MEGKVDMEKNYYRCYGNHKTKLKPQKYVIVEIINNVTFPIFLKGGILVDPGTIHSRFETKLEKIFKLIAVINFLFALGMQ